MTRGSRRGEAKVGAALDAVENGRGGGTFYRAMEGVERTEWRGSPAVSAPSRRWFSKVKRGKRSGRDAELVRGKWRRLGSASIKLRPSAGGGDDGAWCGGASVERVDTVAQAEEGDDLGWAKLGRTAGCHGSARKNSGKRKKKDKRAAREFWAGLILGSAEKKKKIFGF
jgi:hypothetical protein